MNTFHPSRQRFRQKRPAVNQYDKADLIRAIKNSQAQHDATQGNGDSDAPYAPVHTFAGFGLSPEVLANVNAKHYTQPTPVQDQAIGPIMLGHDLIGIANTGTGKTAAFLIPLVDKVWKRKNETVLVIAPTRELAVQIHEELKCFSRGLGIRSALAIGGVFIGHQQEAIRGGVHFLIGTPGRITDLVRSRSLTLSGFHTVVLDEADRMVDIGFIHDIKYFISLLPQDRQSLFFSATVSGKVHEIISAFVHNPITVSVKRRETTALVEQHIVEVPQGKNKVELLHELLIRQEFEKVLIFGRTKWGVERLGRDLAKRGFAAGTIHGNKRQNQRQRTLDSFKNNQIRILLATDVASRGLDIDAVSHVINYDMPQSYDDYVHRIGRTGRANRRGVALTFID